VKYAVLMSVKFIELIAGGRSHFSRLHTAD
jgi:hypothetical protein